MCRTSFSTVYSFPQRLQQYVQFQAAFKKLTGSPENYIAQKHALETHARVLKPEIFEKVDYQTKEPTQKENNLIVYSNSNTDTEVINKIVKFVKPNEFIFKFKHLAINI